MHFNSKKLELDLEGIKWAIINARKLKIKDAVRNSFLDDFRSLIELQDIMIQSGKARLRIDVRGTAEERFYILKSLKRMLPSVIVKAC